MKPNHLMQHLPENEQAWKDSSKDEKRQYIVQKMRGRHILPKILACVTMPNKAALKLLVVVWRLQCTAVQECSRKVRLCVAAPSSVLHSNVYCMRSWGNHAQVMRALAAILLQYTSAHITTGHLMKFLSVGLDYYWTIGVIYHVCMYWWTIGLVHNALLFELE